MREQAQHRGLATWVYLPAPDYSQQLPRVVVYRHEQVRARFTRIDSLALNPINNRPGRAADLAGKVVVWLLRAADALISIGDRAPPTAAPPPPRPPRKPPRSL